MIPLAAEASRIVRGVRVEHVCGDPNLSEENDARLAHRIVGMAMTALQTDVDEPTVFDPAEEANAEATSAS
jgi:hypothetical protein